MGTPAPEPFRVADDALLAAMNNNAAVPVVDGGYPYVICPAETDTKLGATGAIGDVLATLTIDPGATPAAVTIKDGSTTVWVIPLNAFTANVPLTVYLGWTSASGAWHVVLTGTPKGIATGRFTA